MMKLAIQATDANGKTGTVDPQSGNVIYKTENGLRDCDIEAPQHSRTLTDDEIKQLLEEVGNNGNR